MSSFGSFFGSDSSSDTKNYNTDSHNVQTNTQNVDQSQVQTNNQEITTTNSNNSSWSKITDASMKALDSFNKNINYQVATTLNPSDTSGLGEGLDMNSFFDNAQVPFMAGAERDASTLFSTSSTTIKSYMKYVYILAAVAAVWFFFFRKK